MKSLVTTLLAIGFISPLVTYADPFDRYVQDHHIDVSGSASVENETSASASSGGQTAAAGQAVTDGDVSASSHVETHINAGTDGGSVQVHTETTQNGQTETKDYSQDVAPGEPVKVNVSAHADSKGAKVQTKVNGESVKADGETKDSAETSTDNSGSDVSTDADASAEVHGGFSGVLQMVPNFFKKVFDFLFGW